MNRLQWDRVLSNVETLRSLHGGRNEPQSEHTRGAAPKQVVENRLAP